MTLPARLSSILVTPSRWLAPLVFVVAGIHAYAAPAPTSIRVVLDDNYPPYIFRDSAGQPQGILKDLWGLWQRRTGITVDFQPMDWAKARASMESGQADVIDTIFKTEERRKTYDFSRPYAAIEVPIFFHRSITGIHDAASVKGFTVGVKDGDACVDYLKTHGIDELKLYPSYEAQVKAAIRQEIRVLCIDKPPAFYFFSREGAIDEFRHSAPLYVGEFHWAVAKGRTDIKQLVEDGFARISAEERAAIETRWMGARLPIHAWSALTRYGGYVLLAVVLVVVALFIWNATLRRRVALRTAELELANSSARESEVRYRALADLSADWYWEQDEQLRFTSMSRPDTGQADIELNTFVGHTRRDAPGVVWDETELRQLEAITQAQQPFRNFEMGRVYRDGPKHYVSMSGEPMFDASGAFKGYRGVGSDITERKKNQDELLLQAQRAEMLLQLPEAAESGDEKAFMQHGLEIAEQLTGSQIGFLHLVNDDQERIELVTWSQATLAHYCTASHDRHYPVNEAGVWADALRERSSVVINDYASAPGKHGLPDGHARLDRLISVPVIDAGLVRMILGVGNKPQDYTAFDVETTRLVADTVWRIVHQRRADAAMRESEDRYRTLVEWTPDPVMVHRGGKLLYVNPAAVVLAGASSAQELVGKPILDLIDPDFHQIILARLKKQSEDGLTLPSMEQRFLKLDGTPVDVEAQSTPIIYGGQAATQVVARDITERKAAREQIQALAFSDPLTGLPNRRLLLDRLEQALAAACRHSHQDALLFIDLDDFKTLNDTLGHDKGDLLLKQISRRLIISVRESDTVARLGGDEFVVLLQELNGTTPEAAKQAQVLAAKILKALAQPYELEGHAHHSTASIGVTLFGGSQRENIEEPLKRAELAMYQAKAAGRNTLRFFEPEMETAVTARATLEADLREAVAKGQFLLYYQAQGRDEASLTGVEALVRWQHPQRGLVSPLEFIPIAETSGLILPLGRWVLQTACQQLAAWASRPERAQLTMAVNISARQIRQPGFVQEVLGILQATGAKPERLKLELTESVLLDNVQDIIAKMSALKEKGVGFALDDFGTGYSSLSYLKRLPLVQLKIDQGFVRDILAEPNDAAIANMVVALADSMGLEVMAEGVETEAQRKFLANLGCHNYQGYLFAKPVPIEEFEAFAQRV